MVGLVGGQEAVALAATAHLSEQRLHLTRADDKAISFTESGLDHAEGVVRRHRLIERFLTDVLDIPWDEVHEEAERLEHAMSPVLEERMLAAIGDAKTCPHGHTIVAGARLGGVPLSDVAEGAAVTILRFENEAGDLLHYLKVSGLEPGLKAKLTVSTPELVAVTTSDGAELEVSFSVAETVSVIAGPSPPPPRCPSSSCSRASATGAEATPDRRLLIAAPKPGASLEVCAKSVLWPCSVLSFTKR